MSRVLTFRVAIGVEDLTHAFRLHARLKRTRPLLLTVILLLSALAAIVWLSPQARALVTGRPLFLLLEGAVAILLLLVLGLHAASPWLWRRTARRSLAQRSDLAGPIEYRIDPTTITRTAPGSHSTEQLENLREWREDAHVLLLYLQHGLFYVIPTSQLDPAVLTDLRSTLEEAGIEKR